MTETTEPDYIKIEHNDFKLLIDSLCADIVALDDAINHLVIKLNNNGIKFHATDLIGTTAKGHVNARRTSEMANKLRGKYLPGYYN